LKQKGIKVFDSYHLAVAEENDCDVFLTTDDCFLKRAKEIALNIVVENPAKWIVEVI
jgi:predicted nucleic acid-binding protein